MSYWGQLGFPDPGTELVQKLVYYHDLTCMTMVGLGVGIGFFLVFFLKSAFWYKAIKKNEKIEFWWTILPGLWLVFLSYPSLRNLFKMECESSIAGVIVRVIGHQWYWSYDYYLKPLGGEGLKIPLFDKYSRAPFFGKWGFLEVLSKDYSLVSEKVGSWFFCYDSFMTPIDGLGSGSFRLLEVDHRVVLPLSKVLMSITSADVIHSWSVPSLGVKMDAVPGKHNILEFVPSCCGVFYGQCAEICGVNHSYMPIVVEVVLESWFYKWAAWAYYKSSTANKVSPYWFSYSSPEILSSYKFLWPSWQMKLFDNEV